MNSPATIVACKRAPVRHGVPPTMAVGGAAGLIGAMAARLDAPLFASAISPEDISLADRFPRGLLLPTGEGDAGLQLQLVRHDLNRVEGTQNYLWPEVMWPAMHNLWEPWLTPVFDGQLATAWQSFQAFSREYARKLSEALPDVRPRFMLQDYQLVLVPDLLRAMRPDSDIRLFVHCAWGGPEGWRPVPRDIRAALFASMCQADALDFQAARWADAFLAGVREFCPGAVINHKRRTVRSGGHICQIRVIPLGFSPAMIAADRTTQLADDLAQWAGADPLVVTYGRTDPVKNTARTIAAFSQALSANPALAPAKLLVRLAPNHLNIPMNQRYRESVFRAAAACQDAISPESVRIVEVNDVPQTMASYARADVLIFAPILDGQNLGPFEAALVNDRGAEIIISENIGAAEILGDVTTLVNPYDVGEMAAAIAHALRARDVTSAAHRAAERREVVRRYTLDSWIDAQLADICGDE